MFHKRPLQKRNIINQYESPSDGPKFLFAHNIWKEEVLRPKLDISIIYTKIANYYALFKMYETL